MTAQPGASYRALNPILVTGVHRSGTTWVGKMLAASPALTYISEPFNVLHRPGVMRKPVAHWYTYVNRENEAEYLPALADTLRFRYHLGAELGAIRARKDLLRMGRDLVAFTSGRWRRLRPLVKDPFSLFSAPWFWERLGAQVVVTVRHPAAFASSLKRLNWRFDFRDLLAQPLLMHDWLAPHRADMEALLQRPEDVIEQAGLLWKLAYGTVVRWTPPAPDEQGKPRLLIVKHEDLSLDPVGGFRALFAGLGLAFTPQVEETIRRSSSAGNPAEVSRQAVHTVRLDSRANLQNWKRRLEPAEIDRLRALTASLADDFYSPADWD